MLECNAGGGGAAGVGQAKDMVEVMEAVQVHLCISFPEMNVLGAVNAPLEPFCGHSSPKVDKIFEIDF